MPRRPGPVRGTPPLVVLVFPLVLSWFLMRPAFAQGQWDGAWTALDPPARQSFSLVNDVMRDRIVLFGGFEQNGGLHNDVRSLSLQGALPWRTERPLGTLPGPREAQATAYDSRRGRMIVFSGLSGAEPGRVWLLELGEPMTWLPLDPAGEPPAGRQFGTAVYDSLRDRVLLFGGVLDNGTGLNDLWELTLSGTPTWTRLSPSGTPPSPRAGAALVVDPVRDRLVLFGGGRPLLGGDRQTWSLALSGAMEWRQVATSGQPPDGLYGQGGVYDPVGDRFVTIGGSYSLTAVALNLAEATPSWTWLYPADGSQPQPEGRYQNGAVYDPVHNALVICGGYMNTSFDDTWSFSFETSRWTKLAPAGEDLPARAGHAATLDPGTNRVIVYGGQDPFDRFDVWVRDLGGSTSWTSMAPQGIHPDAAYDVASACDTQRHRILYFGGQSAFHAMTSSVWALGLDGSPAWSVLPTIGTPPAPRTGAAAIYDPVGDRLIIFGGLSFSPVNDVTKEVWSLSLSGTPTWSLLKPVGGPGGRAYASASYDPRRNRMLVFGGFNYGYPGVYSDVWALSLGGSPSWSAITATGVAPSGRFKAVAVVDSSRDRLLVHGGGYADAWALNLSGSPQWKELQPESPGPDARRGSAGVYDAIADRMIVTGGRNNTYAYKGDSWALSWAHSIAASAGKGGIIDPRGMVWVKHGGDQTFAARPDAGFEIADMVVDGVSAGARSSFTFVNVLADHSISARFAQSSLPASIDLEPNVINLMSHAPWVTAYIEPSGFDAASIVLSSVRLAGSVPAVEKFAIIGDYNQNGIPDLMLKFAREGLDPLVKPGASRLEVTGSLVTGTRFKGSCDVRVIAPRQVGPTASLAPNPLNPVGVLTLRLPAPGPVTVRMFDLQGRLVRTLMEKVTLPAGLHEVRIDGRGQRGQTLPSGVYLYRVETTGGALTGRVAILK